MEESTTYRYVVEKSRAEGHADGRAEGRAEGKAEGLRRAILDLVAARVESVPEGLEPRLASLDADQLHGLFTRLLQTADESELLSLINGD